MTQFDEAIITKSIVQVTAGNESGTGFQIASGFVVTCAHVVLRDKRQGTLHEDIALYYNGQKLNMDVNVVAVSKYPFPDCALLKFVPDRASPEADLVLKSQRPTTQDDLLVRAYKGNGVTGVTLKYESEETDFPFEEYQEDWINQDVFNPGETLFKLKDGQVEHGFSGAPLLIQSDGQDYVCGVIAKTRNADAPHGGFCVPINAVLEFIRDVPDPELKMLKLKLGMSEAPGGLHTVTLDMTAEVQQQLMQSAKIHEFMNNLFEAGRLVIDPNDFVQVICGYRHEIFRQYQTNRLDYDERAQRFGEIGEELYEVLSKVHVLKPQLKEIAELIDNQVEFNLKLHFNPDGPEALKLNIIPWEYMSYQGTCISTMPKVNFFRSLLPGQPQIDVHKLNGNDKLRMQFVFVAEKWEESNDFNYLRTELVENMLKGRSDIEPPVWTTPPGKLRFTDMLRQTRPHVLHFFCKPVNKRDGFGLNFIVGDGTTTKDLKSDADLKQAFDEVKNEIKLLIFQSIYEETTSSYEYMIRMSLHLVNTYQIPAVCCIPNKFKRSESKEIEMTLKIYEGIIGGQSIVESVEMMRGEWQKNRLYGLPVLFLSRKRDFIIHSAVDRGQQGTRLRESNPVLSNRTR